MKGISQKDIYDKSSNDWDQKASVRKNLQTYDLNLDNSSNNTIDQNWHLPDYSAILNHSNFANISDSNKKFVMGIQLLEFVTKQAIFEIECVNVVASNIALGKYPFHISDELKLDAFKIYTDEGYHAYFTQKIANQIRQYYNVKEDNLQPYMSSYFEKIRSIGSNFEQKFNYLSLLAIVIVGENQIVSDLSGEMRQIVYEPIRIMFRDHMIDESFHAKYFAIFFQIIWPQLSNKEKQILAFNLCDSMILLATPRVDIYHYSFKALGYDNKTISKSISDIYNTYEWKTTKIKNRMAPTLSLLDSCGIFSDQIIHKKFLDVGLI